MNWRKLLTINLTPFHKEKQESGKEGNPVLFPNLGRIKRFLTGRGIFTSRGFELGQEEFQPGCNYRSLSRNWRGPIYFIARNHRADLQYIIGQMRGLVRANVPLASGLESVAREEQRRSRFLGATYALQKAIGFSAALTVAIIIAVTMSGSTEIAALGVAPFILTFIFMVLAGRTYLQERKRLTLANLIAMLVCFAVFVEFVFMMEGRLDRRWVRSILFAEPEDVAFVMLIAMVAFCFVLTYRIARPGGPREMVLVRLRDLLNGGLDLSEAMRRLPRFFPQFYADMVEAGEQTGRMDDCLAELCEDVGTDLRVQRQIRGTMLYLGIVGSVLITIMTFLMIKVVPVFFEIHSEFGSTPSTPFINFVDRFMNAFYFLRWNPFYGLHIPLFDPFHILLRIPMDIYKVEIFSIALVIILVLPVALAGVQIMRKVQRRVSIKSTILMLALYIIAIGMITLGANNRADNNMWMLPIATIMLLVAFFFRFFRDRRRGFSSRSLSSLFLFLPGFRGMVMQDNFTVITGTLEKLLCAGVPLDKAVEKASAGDVNPVYGRMLRRVHKRILEGESLVAAFQQASGGLLVPASFTSLVAVGEQSGMLPEALAYLHTFYRAQANIRARILIDTIKPFGVMAMGLVVMLFMRDMFTMLVGITESILNTM